MQTAAHNCLISATAVTDNKHGCTGDLTRTFTLSLPSIFELKTAIVLVVYLAFLNSLIPNDGSLWSKMCVHELWTYSECGCQVDHLIPCLNALTGDEPPRQPSPLRRCRRKTSLRGIRTPSPLRITKKHGANASPVHLPPSPSPTDSEFSTHIEDYYRMPDKFHPRECSVNHTVTKTFLEPICDDCLLQELGVEGRQSGRPTCVSTTTSDGLIWGSDVKIEVSEQATSPQTHILESNVEVLIEEAISDTLPALKYQDGPVGHARQASALSATDADDEGSIRGRARSRTKQLRRKGIDITREQLRISSRLPTWDKQALEMFRDDIQRKAQDALSFERGDKKEQSPGKSFLKRFKEAESGSKSWVREVVGDLKRNLSRNSKLGKQGKDCRVHYPAPTSPSDGVCTLRAVIDGASTTSEEQCLTLLGEEEACPAPEVPFSKCPEIASSWQAHLSRDLAPHQRSQRQIHASQSTSRLNSTHSSDRRTSSGPNWFATSKSSGSLPLRSISERDCGRHLLSMTSTAPSVPATASSTWSGPPTGQRLASIISDSEFDTFTELPWNTPLIPVPSEDDCEADATTINDDATSIAPSSHRHATSIDTKNSIHTADPASPPRRVRPRVHHAHTDTPRPTKGLTMHPLTTPVRIATPLRPAFTPRTCSLSSPPMSSPARLGGNAMSHSPTAHFVCTWERFLCKGGCGKVVGEGVKSCVCDGGNTVGCRSTAPVVRYVDAGGCQMCGICVKE